MSKEKKAMFEPRHGFAEASPNCPKCGASPESHEVKNYDIHFQDGDVYCTICNSFVRSYDAG